MNLRDIHDDQKEVSAKVVSKLSGCTATAIRITENGILKEHITKTPALLVCVAGEVVYRDEKGVEIMLRTGDYHDIEPMVKHWLVGVSTCQLLLVR
ncbi:MAG: hypothetical protein R2824_20850 [Saprospiraceae bacterium]|nr:hypothetical protein [Lewinella sp.]